MRNGQGRRQRGNGRHGTALNGSRLNPGPTWDVGAVTKNGSRCQISECAVLLSDSAARRCVLSENTAVSFWGRSVPPLTRLCNYEKAVFCYRTWTEFALIFLPAHGGFAMQSVCNYPLRAYGLEFLYYVSIDLYRAVLDHY